MDNFTIENALSMLISLLSLCKVNFNLFALTSEWKYTTLIAEELGQCRKEDFPTDDVL